MIRDISVLFTYLTIFLFISKTECARISVFFIFDRLSIYVIMSVLNFLFHTTDNNYKYSLKGHISIYFETRLCKISISIILKHLLFLPKCIHL